MRFYTCLMCSMLLQAQNSAVLSVGEVDRPHVKRGDTVMQKLNLSLRAGFHVNSNTPSDEFLIPLKLTWAKGPLASEQITYPDPHLEKSDFAPKPLSVFSGNFQILTRFRAAANADPGMGMMTGKLRYQACNSHECLMPKTIDVQFVVDIQ